MNLLEYFTVKWVRDQSIKWFWAMFSCMFSIHFSSSVCSGMDSGFNAGEDDTYNVYDKAWRSEKNIGQSIYRPTKAGDSDVYGGDIESAIKTSRFIPDKEFSGVDRAVQRVGPVQFEKHAAKPVNNHSVHDDGEADPFGLDKFLKEAKKGTKRTEDDRRRGGDERERDRSPDRSRDHRGDRDQHERKKRRGSWTSNLSTDWLIDYHLLLLVMALT